MSRYPDHRDSSRRTRPRDRGHRRELAERAPERRSFQDRLQGALVDVAIHRAVASRDLVDHQFGGHPFAGRRGIDNLKKAGLVEEHKLHDTQVLTATAAGRRLAGDVAPGRGWHSDQRTWSGLGKDADLKHDLALYRAVALARAELAERGLQIRRVRLDAELRSLIAKRTEAVRARRGSAAAAAARAELAARLHLPVTETGKVLYPDAQIEYARDEVETGRVNIEITTEHYSKATIAAKSAAGFVLFPSGAAAGRQLAGALHGPSSLSAGGNRGRGRGASPAGANAAAGRRGRTVDDDLIDL